MAQVHDTPRQSDDERLEKIFSMAGGEGQSSYARNSERQGYRWGLVKGLLEEAVQQMSACPREVLRIADLGCSSTQNTVNTMDFIVEKIKSCYATKGHPPPEIHAFFNDLPSTDFNTLFRLLLPSTVPVPEEKSSTAQGQHSYYVAGVPGSFFKRLFPKSCLHLVHSAYSIQWISKVPAEALDKNSPAYNKGRVFIHNGPAEPAKAFARQFEEDFLGFLSARAEEMESGGQMFLTTGGREDTVPETQDALSVFFGEHYEKSWQDLVTEGLLSEEKRDSFNVPTYMPSVADCRAVVDKVGSYYRIEKLELLGVKTYSEEQMRGYEKDAGSFADMLTGITKSVSLGLTEDHIGVDLTRVLFERYHKHVEEAAAYVNPLFYNMKALVVHLVRT